MKIALVGMGRMGKMIASCAEERGIEVAGAYLAENIDELANLGRVDALIDFSSPAALVCGTTGYSAEEAAEIRSLAECAPVILSANYSVGVAVLKHLSAQAAKLLGDDFDIEIVETHHRMKADAPSGTAKLLLRAIDPEGKRRTVYGREGMMKREGNEIGVHAVRGGTVAGVHTVSFFGPDEELSLTHRAESRRIFALGAIKAGERLKDRAPGWYTMDDLLFS